MKSWYCVIRGERRGPLTEEELRACAARGELHADDYVWTADFGGSWKRAAEVPGLIPPPPLAVQPPVIEAAVAPVEVRDLPPLSAEEHAPSCLQAFHEAWQRMETVLFTPFDVALWFGIGLCAWLATVGGWGSLIDLSDLANTVNAGHESGGWREVVEAASGALKERLFALLTVSAVALAGLFTVLMMWLRACGAFLLIDRWHRPRAPITESWRAFRELGRSLFVVRLAVGAAFAIVLAAWFGLGYRLRLFDGLLGLMSLSSPQVLWLAGILLTAAAWVVVGELDRQFVVPVMYWRRLSAIGAWRVILSFCNHQPFAVIRFFLFRMALAFAIFLAVAVGTVLTCCLLFVVKNIPYFGSVLYLPVTFFQRGLGISYLRQWKPDLAGTPR